MSAFDSTTGRCSPLHTWIGKLPWFTGRQCDDQLWMYWLTRRTLNVMSIGTAARLCVLLGCHFEMDFSSEEDFPRGFLGDEAVISPSQLNVLRWWILLEIERSSRYWILKSAFGEGFESSNEYGYRSYMCYRSIELHAQRWSGSPNILGIRENSRKECMNYIYDVFVEVKLWM